jgi:hypothetical protein
MGKSARDKETNMDTQVTQPLSDNSNTRQPRVLNLRRDHIPRNAVYIGRGRGSKLGNPFVIGRDGSRAEVIESFNHWIVRQRHLREAISELRGRDVVCFCAPQPCHGDVLLRLANCEHSTFRDRSASLRHLVPVIERYLRDRGGAHLVAEYSGANGNGKFETLRLWTTEGTTALLLDDQLTLKLRAVFRALLLDRHPTWFAGDGSCGDFRWDIRANHLTHTHYVRGERQERLTYHGLT